MLQHHSAHAERTAMPAVGHGWLSTARGKFALAFALTLGILAVEIVAALLAHSLALLSEAGHVVTDAFALGLGWFAARQASRPATARNTWGYHRVGIIAALVNSLTLLAIVVAIAVEAVERLRQPPAVNPPLMIGAAAFAILVNLGVARVLGHTHHTHDGEHHHEHADVEHANVEHADVEHAARDLNTSAARLHVLGDIGAAGGVVVGAALIALTGWMIIDPLISLAIAAVVAIGAVRVGRDAVSVLLEAAPRTVNMEALGRDLTALPGIYGVHHLHVWGITNTRLALSCHAIVDDVLLSQITPVLERINQLLRERYHIDHATVQFEGHLAGGHTATCACQTTGEECACSLDPATQDRVAHSR